MLSRSTLYSRSRHETYQASESSEADLLEYCNMAQLHPPYVVEACAVGVKMRKNDQKRFVFQLDLNWSDDSCTTSYRSYSEFFDFQCDLLLEFPKEGGSQKGMERVIPYLPGKKMFQKSNQKLAESRLPQIDAYVKTLTSLPENVSQAELTCRFFRSNWQEDKLRSEEEVSVRYSVSQHMSQDQLLPGVTDLSPTLQEPPEIASSGENATLSGI